MTDGVGSITVPEDVLRDAPPLWEDFLVGKFLDSAPHIAKIHAIVNKIWAMGDKTQMIDVFDVNSTTMKFRISNPIIRNKIVRRGMWNLAGIPVVMSKWTPFIEAKQMEKKSVPLWVHLHNVPMNMFSWKGLSVVSSPVGVPVKLHPETAQCLNMKVAKIFVNADLSKDLPKTMNFAFQGKNTRVDYTYPWLPTKCSNCGKWGHLEKACLIQAISSEDTQLDNQSDKEAEVKSKEGQVENGQGGRNSGGMVGIGADQTEGVSEKEKERGVEVQVTGANETAQSEENNGEEENNIKENEIQQEAVWSSPAKACRSPNKSTLESGQASMISNSRFSILSTEEEGEIIEGNAECEESTGCDTLEKDREEDSLNVSAQSEKTSKVKKHRGKETVIPRQSLPRGSKDNHKFLSDSSALKAKEGSSLPLSRKNT
ncbi:hypothetical protein N665_0104s0105 [Sinapis alba]|nr:hypothetical protein N665_0104s0105 [Sinapis alba]